MSRITLGVICGLVFGAIDFGIMLSMSFPDKRAAIMAAFYRAFCDRIRHWRRTISLASSAAVASILNPKWIGRPGEELNTAR
jgi:hypothetical protein